MHISEGATPFPHNSAYSHPSLMLPHPSNLFPPGGFLHYGDVIAMHQDANHSIEISTGRV